MATHHDEPLHLVYLAGVDYASSGFQTAAIRGIRHIREVLGSDNSFGPAKEAVDRFLTNPTVKMLVDATNDAELAQRAVEQAKDYHQGAALFEINPSDLSLPDPDVDPEAETVEEEPEEPNPAAGPFSPAAYKTAMALLAMENGNPTAAFMQAKKLAHVTDDPRFYEEVQYALLSVFPPVEVPS